MTTMPKLALAAALLALTAPQAFAASDCDRFTKDTVRGQILAVKTWTPPIENPARALFQIKQTGGKCNVAVVDAMAKPECKTGKALKATGSASYGGIPVGTAGDFYPMLHASDVSCR
jgi:hypothetical protein